MATRVRPARISCPGPAAVRSPAASRAAPHGRPRVRLRRACCSRRVGVAVLRPPRCQLRRVEVPTPRWSATRCRFASSSPAPPTRCAAIATRSRIVSGVATAGRGKGSGHGHRSSARPLRHPRLGPRRRDDRVMAGCEPQHPGSAIRRCAPAFSLSGRTLFASTLGLRAHARRPPACPCPPSGPRSLPWRPRPGSSFLSHMPAFVSSMSARWKKFVSVGPGMSEVTVTPVSLRSICGGPPPRSAGRPWRPRRPPRTAQA